MTANQLLRTMSRLRFDKFSEEGVPQYRVYYKDIKSVTAVSDLVVRIEMETPNREKAVQFCTKHTCVAKTLLARQEAL